MEEFFLLMMIKMIYSLNCNNLQNFEGIGQKVLCRTVFNSVFSSLHKKICFCFLSDWMELSWNYHRQLSFCPDSNRNSDWFKGSSTVFDVVIIRLICHKSYIHFLVSVSDVSCEKLNQLYFFVEFFFTEYQ